MAGVGQNKVIPTVALGLRPCACLIHVFLNKENGIFVVVVVGPIQIRKVLEIKQHLSSSAMVVVQIRTLSSKFVSRKN